MVFDRLPVEDECIMEVVGMYGTTKVTYRTPYCYPGDCPPCKCPIKSRLLVYETQKQTHCVVGIDLRSDVPQATF